MKFSKSKMWWVKTFKIENARIWKLPKIEIEKGLANRKCNINAIQFEDSSPNVEM